VGAGLPPKALQEKEKRKKEKAGKTIEN